jgi:hypothetical protein
VIKTSKSKLVAHCTALEYEEVFAKAHAAGQTISEYIRTLLGLEPDGWVEPGRKRTR